MSAATDTGRGAASRPLPLRVIAIGSLVMLLAVLLWKFAGLIGFGAVAIGYPYELDYGEGIVWEQMRLMFSAAAYGPIDTFPAIVFHYTPVYHALSALVTALLPIDGLAGGRLLSLAATLATACIAAVVTVRILRSEIGNGAAAACGAIAGLAFLSVFPVVQWAALMRVDMVALVLAFVGVHLAIRALDRPWLIHAAALAFVLAVYAKQTMIAAPTAVFLILFLARPRLAWAGFATALAAGAIALAGLAWITDGGFVRHVFLYNVNRFDPARLSVISDIAVSHAVYLAMATLGVVAAVRMLRCSLGGGPNLATLRERLARNDRAVALLILLSYLLLTTLMLPTVGKSGSNVNYLIEWMGVGCLFVGLGAGEATRMIGRGARAVSPALALMLPALLALNAGMLPGPPWAQLANGARPAELAALTARIAVEPKPVISDDMVVLLRSGRPVLWESAIFAELASTGQYDERPFVAKIRNGDFGFFVTVGQRGGRLFDQRYTPAVADAIDAAYPHKEKLAGLTLRFPAAPASDGQAGRIPQMAPPSRNVAISVSE